MPAPPRFFWLTAAREPIEAEVPKQKPSASEPEAFVCGRNRSAPRLADHRLLNEIMTVIPHRE